MNSRTIAININLKINIRPVNQHGESHKQSKQSVEKLQRWEDMLIQTLCHMYGGIQDTGPRGQTQETHGNPHDKSRSREKRIDSDRRQRGV